MKQFINLFFCSLLFAAEQKMELGYFGTTGNSNTTSLTAAYHLDTNLSTHDKFSFWFDILYASKDGSQSSERYRMHLSDEHRLHDSLFLFAQLSFLRNIFEGYNQQYNAACGFGKRIYSSTQQYLDLLAGYQFRRNNYVDQPSQNFNYAKVEGKYRYNFTSKNYLTINTNFIGNLEHNEDYEIQTTTDMILWIVDRLNFKLSFEVKYDNLPPVGKEKSDTITKATIVYNF